MMDDAALPGENPESALLDRCRAGDFAGALDRISPGARLSVTGLDAALVGQDAIRATASRALDLFPDLRIQSHTRHIGQRVVVDDGRVTGTHTGGPNPSGRRLDLPVRVTVRTTTSMSISIAFPEVLLRQALGESVDRYDVAAAAVYAAVSAPVEDAMTTFALAEPATSAPTAGPSSENGSPEGSRRRPSRARVVAVGGAVVMAAVLAVWLAAQPGLLRTSHHARSGPSIPTVTTSPSGRAASSPVAAPVAPQPPVKPHVTLTSDLAFGFDRAELSARATQTVMSIARQVRSAGLSGTVYVDGYTDNIGSPTYGLHLSQRRADAVAGLLRSRLGGLPIIVVALGHGEADPVASNATDAGRQQNRRVTITLPEPH